MLDKKNKKSVEKNIEDLEVEWVKADDKNLFLNDMTPKTGHIGNLSTNKKGKEITVGKQISSYLKSMGILEKSTLKIEETIERANRVIVKTRSLVESKTVSKKFKGKMYTSTERMINAVKLYEAGKISKDTLLDSASWAANPDSAIEVAQMIAGIGRFR